MAGALYIHWPFCLAKCPYCDFNSHVRSAVDHAQWQQALLADLAWDHARSADGPLQSIFFGGGTPSLMPPALVAALIERADQLWGLADGVEITLEANPSSVEASRFAALAAAGVNRVSLGIQSLDDTALKDLGRLHDAAEAMAAIGVAQRHFARVNLDFIYARPGQSLGAWEEELNAALSFGSDHLSLYQLTIEPGTRYETLARQGKLHLPRDDDAASMFEMTRAITAAAGLPAYEVSNHARPGQESRHNLAYWRYRDYLGVGPGAHGRRGTAATQRHKKPENWLAAVNRNGHGCQSETPLPPAERAMEALLMGLRLAEGVDLADIAARTAIAADQLIDAAALDHLSDLGLVQAHGSRVTVLDPGFLLLDAILPRLVAVSTEMRAA